MYTYKNPYKTTEYTKDYFQERGELAVYRALNVGRVIGFIGSGVTAAYGRSTWKELVQAAMGALPDAKGKPEKHGINYVSQKAVFDGLKKEIENPRPNPDSLILALGLTERLAEILGARAQVRRAIIRELAKSRSNARDDAVEALSAISLEHTGTETPTLAINADPVAAMVETLGIRRYLTLNYDVEIERSLAENLRVANRDSEARDAQDPFGSRTFRSLIDVKDKEHFPRFVWQPDKDPDNEIPWTPPLGDSVDFSDGGGKSVLSVNLSSKNIGDLVNFSLLPRRYGAQVFHLHGRHDDPDSMVLTEEDYQRLYLGRDESAYCFDEAMDTVFLGNDILLVGVGMDESDMFRPLRQFARQDSARDLRTRNVFVLRERKASFSIDLDKFDADKPEAFFKNNLEESGEKFTSDDQSDTIFSLKMKTNFGVWTIFFGDAELRYLLLVADCMTKIGESLDSKTKPDSVKIEVAASLLKALSKRKQTPKTNAGSGILSKEEEKRLKRQLRRDAKHVRKLFGSSAFKKGKKKFGKRRQKWATAFKSQVRSRALENALKDLRQSQDDWWTDWRQLPLAREAQFRKTYLEGDEDKREYPCEARHRPAYTSWTKPEFSAQSVTEATRPEAEIATNEVLSRLRSMAGEVDRQLAKTVEDARDPKQANASTVYVTGGMSQEAADAHRFDNLKGDAQAKRILRVAMPRGSGKGALMHLLQQQVEGASGHRRVLDCLFSDNDRDFRYHGAFLVHLSFSMEFASVINSLAYFVLGAVVGLLVDEDSRVEAFSALANKKNVKQWSDDPVLRHLLDRKSSKLLRKAVRKLEKLRKKSHDMKKEGKRADKRRKTAKILVQELRHAIEFGQPPSDSNARSHRVEMCRMALIAFRKLSHAINQNDRLFLCFVGLDKLCDANGNAYNPMYRALFRLLTGEGCKYDGEADPCAPVDILLIASDPHKNVRYLSEMYDRAAVEKEMGEKPIYLKFQAIEGTDLFMRNWPQIEGIPIKDRFWLKQAPNAAVRKFHGQLLDVSEGQGPQGGEKLPADATIRQFFSRGVALSSWCAGAWALESGEPDDTVDKNGRITRRKPVSQDLGATTMAFLRRLDAAADRGGLHGVLTQVLQAHHASLQRQWKKECAQLTTDAEAHKARFERWPNAKAHLFDLVLKHLTMFPLPVELRVLYSCDEINFLLHQMYDLPGQAVSRDRCLEKLHELLDEMWRRHIIIKVTPKRGNENSTDSWQKHNSRYTIQHQLREHIAASMDLSVPDRGERNFFQVTLYCDQPKDLPTPTEDHYRMYRAIVDRQITEARKTLWCLHNCKLGDDGEGILALKTDSKLAFEGLKRRLRGDASKNTNLDPDLASFFGAAQRIRAVYGLLRGGLSIGAISRLDSFEDSVLADEPLERFRGWLRGVTNAAVSMGKLEEKLRTLALETQNPDPDGTAPEVLKLALVDKRTRKKTRVSVDFELKDPTVKLRRPPQPLYRDDFGWLFNERGVVALVQGNLYDAVPLFQRAIHIMNHRDHKDVRDASLHAAVRRVKLNLSIAQIERGNLSAASAQLQSLLLPGDRQGHYGSTVSWIANGYLGLIKHLGGDLRAAQTAYDHTISQAEGKEMLRLQSIFRRLRSDLHRALGMHEQTLADCDLAIAAAKHSEQRDILWAARLTRVKAQLSESRLDQPDISPTIEDCLVYARTMPLPRLESEALRLQAELLLRQGDRVLAGKLAANAAAVASHAGLRLLKISAMRTYAKVLDRREMSNNSDVIIQEANREAERRGYLNTPGQKQGWTTLRSE